MPNGEAPVTGDQCERRMNAARTEMDVGFGQVREDLKELLAKMEDTRKEIAATAAAEAVRAACEKLDEVKARAIEKAEIVKSTAEEKAARTLKDQILDHKIEILLVAILVFVGGDNVLAFFGFIQSVVV